MIISTVEEEEIIEVEVEKNIEEEDMTISIKEETTTSFHIVKEEMKIILVLPIEEDDCSNHMCGKHELFSTLNEAVKSTYFDSIINRLDLHHNLLSMKQLLKKCYTMQIHYDYFMLINKNGIFIAK
ncbi:hypothetical protein CR513_50785, partial [Mucuna pruriens]